MISFVKQRFGTFAEFAAQRKTARRNQPASGVKQPIAISQLCRPATSGFGFVEHHLLCEK
jgi:hypothetical protein